MITYLVALSISSLPAIYLVQPYTMDPLPEDPLSNVSPDPQDACIIAATLPPPTNKRRRTLPITTDCCRTCRLRKVRA